MMTAGDTLAGHQLQGVKVVKGGGVLVEGLAVAVVVVAAPAAAVGEGQWAGQSVGKLDGHTHEISAAAEPASSRRAAALAPPL